jgi:hypothetical protein
MNGGRIVFLLEERSMKTLLDVLLPRLIPGWIEHAHFQCIAFEGKSDLEANVTRKLQAWREPGVRFVVMRDNDGAVCVDLKARLAQLCSRAGRPDTLIRLVCQQLEGWYLGDLSAVSSAFGVNADTAPLIKKYADPDRMTNADQEMAGLVPTYQKIGGSRTVAPHLVIERNRSRSFQVFVEGLRRIAIG